MTSNTRFFRKTFTGDRQLDTLQTNIEQAIAQPIKTVIINGRLIQNVVLATGDNQIEHRLDRVPQGYIVVKRNNGATIYDTSATDANFLILNASAPVTVSLWVF